MCDRDHDIVISCMQPSLILITASTPILAFSLWNGLPGIANSRSFELSELPPLPEIVSKPSTDESEDSTYSLMSDDESAEVDETSLEEIAQQTHPIWIQVSDRVTLASLAIELGLEVEDLAKENGRSTGHVYHPNQWVRFNSSLKNKAETIKQLKFDSLTHKEPNPELIQKEVATVQHGDSLASFLKRHGLSSDELQKFNPGLDVASLTIGRQVRVAQAASGQKMLAIRPSMSGAASWPKLPQLRSPFHDQPGQFSKRYMWPTKGVFTSGYGWRWGRMHKGIDIANNTGTTIHASRDGIITYAGWSSGYGYLVEITHSDGESTRYAHNSRLLVKKGQIVPQGSRISLMGSTGRSTGPHLHFEIRRAGGAAVNPLSKLPTRKA